jgi:hypothetical protein
MPEHGRETADQILDIYNASRKGELEIEEARKKLVEIDPVLIESGDWLSQRAFRGAQDVGGYPISGRNTDELKTRITYVEESPGLFRILVRVGAGVKESENAFREIADLAPSFLDVPGASFPPPSPFSNPRVRALFEHPVEECKHNLDLRREGLYFVEEEKEIVQILKRHITGEISRSEAEEKLRDIHPGLLNDYDPPPTA